VPVVIKEIVTEVVLAPQTSEKEPTEELDRDELVEQTVRRATERVLEILRREWEA
jgi:hypothetical protein